MYRKQPSTKASPECSVIIIKITRGVSLNFEQLESALRSFKDLTIAVVGDYFLDKYLIIDSELDEASIETGLTAYQVTEKRMNPGAAGTIVNNLKALGVGRIIPMGIIGDDGEGYDLIHSLESNGIQADRLIKSKERVTPTYTKPLVRRGGYEEEINRLDIKNWSRTPEHLIDRLADELRALSNEADAVIALDQILENDCGVITSKMRQILAEIGRDFPNLTVYADSRANIGRFCDVIVKCNQHELAKLVMPGFKGEFRLEMIEEHSSIMHRMTHRPIFVTWGARGQVVFDGCNAVHVPAVVVEGPLDICGAGDAATSGIVTGLCTGMLPADAAVLGNIVASITVQQLGTTGTASPAQVLARYSESAEDLSY